MNVIDRPTIYLSYIKVSTFSGQTASSVLLNKLLQEDHYLTKNLYLYPVDRTKNKFISLSKWFFKSITIFPKWFELLFDSKSILYINVGQSNFSLFRILWWYLPLRWIAKMPVIMSLNGNDFVAWESESLLSKRFVKLLKTANYVTVVGSKHAERLQEIGVESNRVVELPNTLDSAFLNQEEVLVKHEQEKIINVLFLSLLIESKGFVEFIEAIHCLAKKNIKNKISVILCGPITRTKFCNRFSSSSEVHSWIKNQEYLISKNGNNNVTFQWIDGAKGSDKQQLYNQAHIFVLPTYYPNEAQPLVLLEAMAAGCSVITTRAGEIASSFSKDQVVFLNEVNSESIASEITKMIVDVELRKAQVLNAYNVVRSSYSPNVYRRNWIELINKLY